MSSGNVLKFEDELFWLLLEEAEIFADMSKLILVSTLDLVVAQEERARSYMRRARSSKQQAWKLFFDAHPEIDDSYQASANALKKEILVTKTEE